MRDDGVVTEGAAVEAGWQPDPTGRAHVRYWDGSAWTESVAAWGETWSDPMAAGPGRPDASLLSEPALTIHYGRDGLEAPGRWPITDVGGRLRGSIIAEAHAIEPRYAWRHLVLDPSELVVLTIAVALEGWSPVLAVTDARGIRVGGFVFPLTTSRAEARVGSEVIARANPFEGRPVVTIGPGWDAGAPVRLLDAGGTAIATVTDAEDRSALRRFAGARQGSTAPDPTELHLDLVRPPGLPEPQRSLALAFVVAFADRVHAERVDRRSTPP